MNKMLGLLSPALLSADGCACAIPQYKPRPIEQIVKTSKIIEWFWHLPAMFNPLAKPFSRSQQLSIID
jgi:hypothetical protein